MVADHAADTCL